MKQDITFGPVEGVTIAIVPDQPVPSGEGQLGWTVYLLNANEFPLQNVLISAEGYGTQPSGEAVRTTTLRYRFAEVGPRSATPVELIDPAVFHLTNQYWLSYYLEAGILDKKFLFVPGSIELANLSPIDLLPGRDGVLHG